MSVPLETTSSHSHSHSHAHPHAEPATPTQSEKDEEEESIANGEHSEEEKALPVRLDRLIAFLDSYFGRVELISPGTPSSTSAETSIPTKEEEEGMKVDDEEKIVEVIEEDNKVDQEIEEVKVEKSKVPVIRVHLDEHYADVTVEDLVCFFPS